MSSTTPALAPIDRPAADQFVRRALRIPDRRIGPKPDVHKAFSASILVSAVRCTLTYVVLPFLAPALGWATGVGPWIGLPLGLVAIASNVVSIRRFWVADHKWRWRFTAISLAVIVLLLILMVGDIAELLD